MRFLNNSQGGMVCGVRGMVGGVGGMGGGMVGSPAHMTASRVCLECAGYADFATVLL